MALHTGQHAFCFCKRQKPNPNWFMWKRRYNWLMKLIVERGGFRHGVIQEFNMILCTWPDPYLNLVPSTLTLFLHWLSHGPFLGLFWSGLGKFGPLKEKSWFSLLKEARDAGQAKITVSTSHCLCSIISLKDGGEKTLMVSISATKDTHGSSRWERGS